MKSSPFLLQRIFWRVILLCPRRWQCICCRPRAICFTYLFTSPYSKGPNSYSKFLREQLLYSSEITYRFSLRVTYAQIGRMLGCQNVTFQFFQRGIRLTKRFELFQQATGQLSWIYCLFEVFYSLIMSYPGYILLSYSNWIVAEGGRVLCQEGGVRRQFLLTFLMELVISTEVITLFCMLMLFSLLSMKSCFLFVQNSSFRLSFYMLVLFYRLIFCREDLMFQKRYRNLLFSSYNPSLPQQSTTTSTASPLLPRADLIFSNLSLNLLWSLVYLQLCFLLDCAGVKGGTSVCLAP